MSEPDLVAPPYAAEMVTVVDAATPLVLTVKVPVIAPLQPLRWNGTVAAVVLPLESIDLRAACASWTAQRDHAGGRTPRLSRSRGSARRGGLEGVKTTARTSTLRDSHRSL